MSEDVTVDQVENASRLNAMRDAARERGEQMAMNALKTAGKNWLMRSGLWAGISAVGGTVGYVVGIGALIGLVAYILFGPVMDFLNFFGIGGAATTAETSCASDPTQCNAAGAALTRERPMDYR